MHLAVKNKQTKTSGFTMSNVIWHHLKLQYVLEIAQTGTLKPNSHVVRNFTSSSQLHSSDLLTVQPTDLNPLKFGEI